MKVRNVIRKFRRMYWYQRDRGKGKKSSGRKRKKEGKKNNISFS